MYGVWLSGVLAAAAAGVNRMQTPDVPACVVDAADEDVMMMLGRPDRRAVGCRGADTVTFWCWRRVDWLGGRRTRVVIFLDGIADMDKAQYEPFAETPPWLKALRDAFAPRPRPALYAVRDSV